MTRDGYRYDTGFKKILQISQWQWNKSPLPYQGAREMELTENMNIQMDDKLSHYMVMQI